MCSSDLYKITSVQITNKHAQMTPRAALLQEEISVVKTRLWPALRVVGRVVVQILRSVVRMNKALRVVFNKTHFAFLNRQLLHTLPAAALVGLWDA